MTYRPEHDAKLLSNILKLPSQAAAVAGCRRWSDEINLGANPERSADYFI